jgi:hypothetical protein
MGSIDTIRSHFFEFKWEIGKYFTGQDIKRYRILPNPKFFKAPIDVFTIHGFIYFMYRRIFQSDGMQLNPI